MTWFKGGDRCSKFFHRIANYKALRNRVQDISTSSGYVTDPDVIKTIAVEHFEARFNDLYENRLALPPLPFRRLSNYQSANLEASFTAEEIKASIDACGSGKSPGPDGFSLKFYKVAW